MSYTYVILDVSAACYQEIRDRLAGGYVQALYDDGDGREITDMHGVALCVTQAAREGHSNDEDGQFPLCGVNSSNIKAAGWQAGKLRVRFTSGGLYEYDNVTSDWFKDFLGASSKGAFFQAVKKNPAQYRCRKIADAVSR